MLDANKARERTDSGRGQGLLVKFQLDQAHKDIMEASYFGKETFNYPYKLEVGTMVELRELGYRVRYRDTPEGQHTTIKW